MIFKNEIKLFDKPRIQTENTIAETVALDILLKYFYDHGNEFY